MRRIVALAPALVLAFLPPACIGTESGNPRCRAAECPIDVELDVGPFAGEVVQVRGLIDGTDAAAIISLEECSGRPRSVGELRWSVDDATRTADGALTVRPTTSRVAEPSWLEQGGRWLVVDGTVTITPDATLSGELFVVDTGVDAAAADRHRLRIEGELDVVCGDGESGVALGAADGSGVLVRCNSTHEDPPPCDDNPSSC